MYQFSYAEVMDDAGDAARRTEAMALDRSIQMLRTAADAGPQSREAIDAIQFAQKLWIRLIEDLGQPENDLPKDLRASLVSIGIWMLKEAERIRLGQQASFAAMIDIATIVREGLK